MKNALITLAIAAVALLIIIGYKTQPQTAPAGYYGPASTTPDYSKMASTTNVVTSSSPSVSTSQQVAEEQAVDFRALSNVSINLKSDPDNKVIGQLQNIWNQYVAAAKAHNVDALKNLSYQQSEYCANYSKYQKECLATMDSFVKEVADLNIKNFTIVWYDSMQAILMEPPQPAELTGYVGFYIPRIIFGSINGSYRLLAIDLKWGKFANVTKISANNIPTFLENALRDSDKDGLTDMEENCDDGNGPGSIKDCVMSDPYVRDGNHNGWWDGVEEYIRPISVN